MLVRGDRLPDFTARLSSGENFLLSHDAGGLPVVIVVGAPGLQLSAMGLVIHVDPPEHPARRGVHVMDDGSIAAALTGGHPGLVVAGRDHRVLASGPLAAADGLVDLLVMSDTRATVSTVVRRAVPLLTIDDVLEPDLCRALIEHLDAVELVDSPSFTADAQGHHVLRVDHGMKARLDHVVTDAVMLDQIVDRLQRRLLPEVERFLAHRPTSFESPKIVRYTAGRGWFDAHRDNATPDSAHRRLAVTLNLDDGYVGGELRFPEFGDDTYRPHSGSAIVFSCGVLHEVTPVLQGDRHALITFMW